MPSSKAVVPTKARLRRKVVQAAAGVERRVGAVQKVKRDSSGPDRETRKRLLRMLQPISTLMWECCRWID